MSGYCQQVVSTSSGSIFSARMSWLLGFMFSARLKWDMRRLRKRSKRGRIWGSIWIPQASKSLIFIFLPLFIQMLMYFLCKTWAKLLGTLSFLQMPKICWRTTTTSANFSISQWILTFFSSSFSSLYAASHKMHSFSSGNSIFCNHEWPWMDLLLTRSFLRRLRFSSFSKNQSFINFY